MEKDGINSALGKVSISWIGGFLGMQLSQWVLLVTLIYTLAQLFFLLRDKWWRERK